MRAVVAGLFALMMAWFVVRPLAGHPIAFGWQSRPMVLSLIANLMWGFGVILIQPVPVAALPARPQQGLGTTSSPCDLTPDRGVSAGNHRVGPA